MTLNVTGTQGLVTGTIDFNFDTYNASTSTWDHGGYLFEMQNILVMTTPNIADTMQIVDYSMAWNVIAAASQNNFPINSNNSNSYVNDVIRVAGYVGTPGDTSPDRVSKVLLSRGVIDYYGPSTQYTTIDTPIAPNAWQLTSISRITNGNPPNTDQNYLDYIADPNIRGVRVMGSVSGSLKMGPNTPLKIPVFSQSWQQNNRTTIFNNNDYGGSQRDYRRLYRMQYHINYTATGIKNP